MDSLNNLLGKIGSALWFGWGNKQAPQQTTASWQGSVNNQLYPQTIADLPQANIQRVPNNLSPRAFDAQWLIDTINQRVQSAPTIDYDFLSSLPNIQTPQWTFVQQTWQVVDNQWQTIGQPNQVIPQVQQAPVVWQQFASQLPVVEQLPQVSVWTWSTLSEVITPTTFKLDETVNASPKLETAIAAEPNPLVGYQSTEVKSTTEWDDVKIEQPTIEDKEWSWLSRTLNIAKGIGREVAWLTYSTFQPIDSFSSYNSLDEDTKAALNNTVYWSNLWDSEYSDKTKWSLAISDITQIWNSSSATEAERMTEIQKKFPSLSKDQVVSIATNTNSVTEEKQKRIAEISGIQYQDTREQKKYEKEQSKKFTDLMVPAIDTLDRTMYAKWLEMWLDAITMSQKVNQQNSEAKRSINLIADAAAALNAWLTKRTDLQWSQVKPIDDKMFQELASNQLQVYQWLSEAWVSWVDWWEFIKQKLQQEWFEWPMALSEYAKKPLVEYIKSLPDWNEKDAILSNIIWSSAVDDAIKSIEIWVNLVNSEWIVNKANAFVQWFTLLWTSMIKFWMAWWWDVNYNMDWSDSPMFWKTFNWSSIAVQTMNAEMNVTNVDFSEDGVAMASKYAYDFWRLWPEVSASIGMVLASNALWAWAASLTTRWINISRAAIPAINVWPKVTAAVAWSLRYINNLLQWTIRALPKVASVLTEESLASSSLQAFQWGTNTAEEFDNYLLWVAVGWVFELVPSLWRLAKNRNANQFWIWRLGNDTARMLVRWVKENQLIAQAEEAARQAYAQSIVKDQWLWYWEALLQAEVDDSRRLTPEQKKTIKDKAAEETILMEDIETAKNVHNNALDRLDALYVNNPELAEKISRTAYRNSKIMDIYKNAVDVADEAERYAALIRSTEISKMNGTNKLLIDQIRDDLDTILPIRIWSQIDNKFNVSLDAFNAKQSWLIWYSLPNELKESLWDINFYKSLDDQKVEFLSEIGITKENVDTYFTKTDEWYLINKQWIDKVWIIDKNSSILQSQVNMVWENKMILDMVESKLGTEASTLIQRTNAIDNIYNSIKNIC